jgi:GNAT superfamily N-acetyltransferase
MGVQDETPVQRYEIDDDPARLDIVAIHSFLTTAYWSVGISIDVVERAVANSYCVGAFDADGTQVGLVRVVTDHATFAYLCDVYVLEAHRGRGLSKRMVAHVMARPDIGPLRRLMLLTENAHGLYERYGFRPTATPERVMEIRRPDAYTRQDGGSDRRGGALPS